ncbi:hypothetical protein [Streptomyces sp. NBC_00474]|uniref:hypothetical protein n=2 Tax=unclassified Streptomyces TaxID=2593676 RepID=UPI002257891B|nr:hypothetical protein [Streptomyces sp. NBC_00474]MCX5048244.1 hypothetical protein [Streptomyces sp. NBC_00474]
MDQGLAAVLGAFVGVVGATTTSILTGWHTRQQSRDQARMDHARWRREVRRDAYAATLVPITEAREVARQASRALVREDAGTDVERLLGRLDELIHAIRASCARLYLEGPKEVAAAADAVLSALQVVDNNLVTWRLARRSAPESLVEYIERHTLKAAGLSHSITRFADEASKALDAVP